MSNNFFQLAKVNSKINNVEDTKQKKVYQQQTPQIQSYENKSEEEYEEDDEEEINNDEPLDQNNEEFIEFKNNVKEWLHIDDDIATLQNAIKERKNKKNELTPKIMDFMGRFQINDLNTKQGKLKYVKTSSIKPLNKDYLISRLGDYFKDFEKGQKAFQFINNNRDKTEKVSLRRVRERKKEFKI